MPPKKADPNAKHEFWDTQPVPKLNDDVEEVGPIERKTLAEVSKDPVELPSSLEWYTPDVNNNADLDEIYKLLADNYVEDDDSIFRFNYSREFLQWATTPPGYKPDWLVGIRKKGGGKVLGFIAGIPCDVRIGDRTMVLCEINFLCVHKVLRSARLAPSLIKEVTRRVNLCDIYQAVYTAGKELPKPFTTCQYFHRSLNPEKLVAIGFSRVPQNLQKLQRPMDALKRTLAVPEQPTVKGIRAMTPKDVNAVQALLVSHLSRYRVAPALSEKDVAHWLLPRKNILYSYVVEDAEGKITDFISFYALASTVLGHPTYSDLRAAYMYYYANTTTKLENLVQDALHFAKSHEFDVFNMLNIMENMSFQETHKFGLGDGFLRYYLFNWKFPKIEPKELGLVMQ